MSAQQDNLAVIVAWLDAMRRGDLRAVTELALMQATLRHRPPIDIRPEPRETRRRLRRIVRLVAS